MKSLFILIFLLMQGAFLFAQGNLTPAANLLFRNSATKASITDKNKIAKDLGLTLSSDKKGLMSGEFPVEFSVYPTDLNKDGREELIIVLGSTSLYGNTGEAFEFYQQNKEGAFIRKTDFSGPGRPTFFTTSNLGYPDCIIGGPGFEFPFYRWNGSTYKYSRMIKDAALEKMPVVELDSLTKR
jgi:hypothetical protein